MTEIYIYVEDEDGHQYCIPQSMEGEFNKLLYDEDNSGLECWERDGWQKFEDMRTEDDLNEVLIDYQKQLINQKEVLKECHKLLYTTPLGKEIEKLI